jgi:hypothetical protein
MSKHALDFEKVRSGLRDVLLGPVSGVKALTFGRRLSSPYTTPGIYKLNILAEQFHGL